LQGIPGRRHEAILLVLRAKRALARCTGKMVGPEYRTITF